MKTQYSTCPRRRNLSKVSVIGVTEGACPLFVQRNAWADDVMLFLVDTEKEGMRKGLCLRPRDIYVLF